MKRWKLALYSNTSGMQSKLGSAFELKIPAQLDWYINYVYTLFMFAISNLEISYIYN